MKIKQSEKEVQKQILEYLAYKKIVSWRQNNGAITSTYMNKIGGLRTRFFKMIRWNWPTDKDYAPSDIGGILEGGKAFYIEVKATGKKPTKEQQNFIDLITKQGGLAFYADSLEAVQSFM